MKSTTIVLVAGVWISLVSIGGAQEEKRQSDLEARARWEQQRAGSEALYEAFRAGDAEAVRTRLQQLSVPTGVSAGFSLAMELNWVVFTALGRGEPEVAVKAGQEALAVLTPERIGRLAKVRERVEAYRMVARIEERVFGRKTEAQRAWRQVLNEAPEDRAAQRAVSRLEQRERLAGQKRQQGQS